MAKVEFIFCVGIPIFTIVPASIRDASFSVNKAILTSINASHWTCRIAAVGLIDQVSSQRTRAANLLAQQIRTTAIWGDTRKIHENANKQIRKGLSSKWIKRRHHRAHNAHCIADAEACPSNHVWCFGRPGSKKNMWEFQGYCGQSVMLRSL